MSVKETKRPLVASTAKLSEIVLSAAQAGNQIHTFYEKK